MKKVFCVLLSVVLLMGALSACGGDSNTNNNNGSGAKGSINIAVANFGTGYEWLEQIADAYMKANPGTKITVTPTVLPHSLLEQLKGGLEGYDIFMGTSPLHLEYADGVFQEIDSVYSSIPQGETKTVAEKMDPNMLNAMIAKVDGHYVQMPWANLLTGFLVNRTTLDTIYGVGNWECPKTTDEWLEMSKDIRSKGHYSFVFSTSDSYMSQCVQTWWNQYDADSYINYFEGMVPSADGTLQEATSGQSLKAPGKLKALQVAETLMKKGNGYAHQYSNSMSFSDAQAAFCGMGYGFSDTKLVAFMPNGSWFENEARDLIVDNEQDIIFAPTPMLSAVIEVLPDKSVENDAELAAVITAIDAGETALSGNGYEVTQADFDYIADARAVTENLGMAHKAGVLANSKNPELAKDFLVFLASDTAGQIYANVTGGLTLPFGYVPESTGATTPFVDTLNAFIGIAKASSDVAQARLNMNGGQIFMIGDNAGWSAAMFAGTKNAEALYNDDIQRYTDQWGALTGK